MMICGSADVRLTSDHQRNHMYHQAASHSQIGALLPNLVLLCNRTSNKLTNSKSPFSMYFVKYNGSPGSPSSSYFAYLGYGLTKDASTEAIATTDITNIKIKRILCAIRNDTDNFNFIFNFACKQQHWKHKLFS